MLHPQDILVLSLCLILHYYYRHRRHDRTQLPLPPGPKRWPLIGNAFSIPVTFTHKYYDEMARKLDTNILYLEAFGRSIVVLNDLKAAQDLLDKRSAIYSSRPHLTMLHDLVDVNHMFAFLPYGEAWRDRRKLFQQYFSPKNTIIVEERLDTFVRNSLLPNLLQSPQNYRSHLDECFGGFAVSITYGLPVRPKGDPWVRMVEQSFTITAGIGQPGKYLVDILPVLKYVPSWMPGAKFKRDAKEWNTLLKGSVDKPFEAANQAMLDGVARPSFVSASLAGLDETTSDYAYRVQAIKETASVVYTAGSETIVASSLTFILAMLKFPEVQRRAQEEVDSVIGHDRLPVFADVEKLPFVSAVMKEVLRWHVIAPTALPHRLDEEDIYEGYLIPKGSIVIGNAYAILRDEKIFPDPQKFIPERFLRDGKLTSDTIDPEDIALFGFGRRICPGSHIGLLGYHLTALCLLSLFDISPGIDKNGKPIGVPLRFTGHSGASMPEPFPCKITPRAGGNTEELLKGFMGVETI